MAGLKPQFMFRTNTQYYISHNHCIRRLLITLLSFPILSMAMHIGKERVSMINRFVQKEKCESNEELMLLTGFAINTVSTEISNKP